MYLITEKQPSFQQLDFKLLIMNGYMYMQLEEHQSFTDIDFMIYWWYYL